jgi:uncharacterized integral membrane protein (TIGR00698 family)
VQNITRIILITIFIVPGLLLKNAAISLLGGLVVSLLINLPQNFLTKKIGSRLLQVAVVFLGATISLDAAIEYGENYSLLISVFVIGVFLVAILLGKLLKVPKLEGYLIAAGSAICGATAIATLAPIINAKPKEISTAIGIVFLLNLLAIIIFPYLGNIMELSQEQFGIWAALAIHDTSSVVGASTLYGEESLKIAATLKVIKTLWIVPLVIFSSYIYKRDVTRYGLPMFIILFLLAVVANYFFTFPIFFINLLSTISSTLLLLGLFCIGTQIDRDSLKFLYKGTVVQAAILWILVVSVSLFVVINY